MKRRVRETRRGRGEQHSIERESCYTHRRRRREKPSRSNRISSAWYEAEPANGGLGVYYGKKKVFYQENLPMQVSKSLPALFTRDEGFKTKQKKGNRHTPKNGWVGPK